MRYQYPYLHYRRSRYCIKWLSTENYGFRQCKNGKRYHCYCLSTELIRLIVSSVDGYFCRHGNWSALSTAQVGKFLSTPWSRPVVYALYSLFIFSLISLHCIGNLKFTLSRSIHFDCVKKYLYNRVTENTQFSGPLSLGFVSELSWIFTLNSC